MSITNLDNGLSSNDKKCPACRNLLNIVYTDYTLGEIIDICTSHKESCLGCPFYLKPDCAFLNLPVYWRL